MDLNWITAEVETTETIFQAGPGGSGRRHLNAQIALDNGFVHIKDPDSDGIWILPAGSLITALYKP
ncbi:hypothetical protein [Streptantibioticus silvisoli]|uniref:Uncharacterized protein n=1 Tax=Streptantibioticus silvisoli TaxID=2705255 RepID=A0ABT6W5V8_9ACTN|nr:hypothetical protein [Streptantibioticus silvisoli]MDI5965770.1 hypothetical protein [Streptantibioticus silvisoli]